MQKKADQIILAAIAQKISREPELRSLKARFADGKNLLPNSTLVESYQRLLRTRRIRPRPTLAKILKKARIRTLSGVSPVAVLTREFPCPGRCVFCPTERGMPKSYLSNEPAVMRAIRAKFDPYLQVTARLQAMQACGHPTTKIELIVMGGTFSALPRRYQTWFIRRCLQALNKKSFPSLDRRGKGRVEIEQNLTSLQKTNESATHRLVGLTLETRPDWITPVEIKRMLRLGCTRVELGVQSLDDEVLRLTKRGHTTAQAIQAIKLLKDAGLKVGLHMMPNLPGATPKKDFAMFQELFANPDYAPDQLKIYPCVVTPHSALAKWWRAGKYKPYPDTILTKLLTDIKALIPPWVRLSRVIRDIPAGSILAGSKLTNLRQILQQKGVICHCIRCREIRETQFKAADVKLREQHYPSSGGEEIFLSFEDQRQHKLISFLRLRLPANTRTTFIREIHSYGAELALGSRETSGQHRGYGKLLIAKAEEIAKKSGYTEIKTPAGIGVRPYYAKLGYRLIGPYMTKSLTSFPRRLESRN